MKSKVLSIFIIVMVLLSLSSCNDVENKNNEKNKLTSMSNVKSKKDELNVNNEENREEETAEKNIYKEDYLEACKLFFDKYIFLEEKLGKTRVEFLNERIRHADKVDWNGGKNVFIKEIRELCAIFPDEHVSFKLSKKLNQEPKFLGFVCKYSLDGKVIVDRVYDEYLESEWRSSICLRSGYEIIEWNGKPIADVIKELGEVNKKSSINAQNEIATRFLTLDNGYMPLRAELNPIEIVYKKYGEFHDLKLEWKDLESTYSYIEQKENEEESALITLNNRLSLEDIPKNYRFINENLIYYFKEFDGIRIAVLHPRDLASWNEKELDKTMERIISINPDVLLVDLEDTVGESSIRAIDIAKAININSKLIIKNEYLNSYEDNNSEAKCEEYYEKIRMENKWTGPVLVRTNSITSGAAEDFARWFQLNNRGIVFGHPTAGAGGICESYSLKNTGTEIGFSVGARTIVGYEKPVEGNPVIPDILHEQSMGEFISTHGEELFSAEIIKKAEQRQSEKFDWRTWNTFGDTVVQKCEEDEWDESIIINYSTYCDEPRTLIRIEERNNPNELVVLVNNARYSRFNFKGIEESNLIEDYYSIPTYDDDLWRCVIRLKTSVRWEVEEKNNPYRQIIKLRHRQSAQDSSKYTIITNPIEGERRGHLPEQIENSKLVKVDNDICIQIGSFSNIEECEVRATELREEFKDKMYNIEFKVMKIEDIYSQ